MGERTLSALTDEGDDRVIAQWKSARRQPHHHAVLEFVCLPVSNPHTTSLVYATPCSYCLAGPSPAPFCRRAAVSARKRDGGVGRGDILE